MRIKSSDVIAGQPAFAMRTFLKGMQGYIGTAETIAEHFHTDMATANQIMLALLHEEYIEPDRDQDHWHNSIKGNALVNATARKPITRTTADRLIAEFLARVGEINAGPYAYRITKVILFGSYLSEQPTLGDIDLSLVIEKRYPDPKQQEKLEKERIQAAHQQGKQFHTFLQQLFWPRQEVLQHLKHRSPSLSLHEEEIEHILAQPVPSSILFEEATTSS
ncbi:hypothetical protein KDH_27620 [Dictyobacter sp. S3.2.2.5]|uniref:Polymerase nucleotidyl transferase domain-containing protein n=1 Tax=Dictyobacter halimunensis TaxID=3026934 RepID=A0ABQ6FNS1_9CHLR|nr:hypothetical protein KDH_27620 [Dictyobacter sp. S3.2.2.5]